jgi:hypothetical protein
MEEIDRVFVRHDFLLENNLKEKSNPQTASNWLAYLGFEYGPYIRSYYTDGHERQEQQVHRVQYGKKHLENEIRKYKWVQLNPRQRAILESLPEDPLEQEPKRTFTAADGTHLYEYHVDQHPKLIERVDASDRKMHGR